MMRVSDMVRIGYINTLILKTIRYDTLYMHIEKFYKNLKT